MEGVAHRLACRGCNTWFVERACELRHAVSCGQVSNHRYVLIGRATHAVTLATDTNNHPIIIIFRAFPALKIPTSLWRDLPPPIARKTKYFFLHPAEVSINCPQCQDIFRSGRYQADSPTAKERIAVGDKSVAPPNDGCKRALLRLLYTPGIARTPPPSKALGVAVGHGPAHVTVANKQLHSALEPSVGVSQSVCIHDLGVSDDFIAHL